MIPSWINKKVVAWASYDFADQAFQALFITLLFPIFLVGIGGSEFLVGLIGGGSVLLAAVFVPFIGAVSDATGRRLPILLYTALATAVLVVAVGLAGLLLAPLIAFVAKVTHSVSKDIYDAKMIDVVTPERYGKLSGLGNAFGYLGTILSLAAAAPIFIYFGWEETIAMQATFFMIAVWYLIFIIPILLFVPDKAYREIKPIESALKQARQEVLETVRNLPSIQPLGRFLTASFFYSNALIAIVFFLGLFSQEIVGLSLQEFFPVFALLALTSGIGALISGRISDVVGPIKVIRVCLYVWLALFLLLLYNITLPLFLVVGGVGGFFFGAVWTMNRHMIATITPPGEIAKIFGFEGLTSRFSGVIGPITFGAAVTFQQNVYAATSVFGSGVEETLTAVSHNYTLGIAILILFLLTGLFILRKL